MCIRDRYRSPEMIDLYRCLPIDEKSDIWALGIFLYKLLFFTTPFELTGQFAILHSKYEFPKNNYSSKLINLIIIMLAENPNLRPNIYQVLHNICSISGMKVPIEDQYAEGPYDFEKYTHFQNKVQSVQYQLYLLQEKKFKTNGKLPQADINLLNDLFVTSFDIASKVPFELKVPTPLPGYSAEIPESNFAKQEQQYEPRNIPTAGDYLNENRKSFTSNDALSRHTSNTADTSRDIATPSNFEKKENVNEKSPGKPIENTEQYFPTVGELDYYLDNELKQQQQQQQVHQPQQIPVQNQNQQQQQQQQPKQLPNMIQQQNIPEQQQQQQLNTDRYHLNTTGMVQRQKSLGSVSTDGRSVGSNSHVTNAENLPTEYTAKSDLPGMAKQHKSNNPFPKMTHAFQSANENVGTYFVDNNGSRQQVQQTEANMYTNLNTEQPRQPAQQPYYQKPGEPTNQQAQQQQQQQQFQQPQQINQRINVGVSSSKNPMNFQNIPSTYSNGQLSQNQQPISLVQQQQQQQTLPSLKQRTNQGFIMVDTDDIPPVVPPHPQTKSGTTLPPRPQSQNPPKVPPHPSKEKEEQLLIDLSPPRDLPGRKPRESTSPLRLEDDTSRMARRSLSLNNPKRQVTLNLSDMSNAEVMESFSTGGVESSVASTESINLDLEDMKHKKGGQEDDNLAEMVARRSIEERETPLNVPKRENLKQKDENRLENITGRRSLDLRYQEINFSPDLRKDKSNSSTSVHHISSIREDESVNEDDSELTLTENEKRQRQQPRHHQHTHFDSSSNLNSKGANRSSSRGNIRGKQDLESYKHSTKNNSNSSIPISTTNTNEMKKSFAKARQSLDLERVRREALLNSDNGKRRSIFSMFRGDKK